MSIGANDSGKQILGSLWTGVANMAVIAINPTMEQLKAMGRNPQKEPEYKSENSNHKSKVRIDFYLYNAINKINAKASFWLEDEPRTNKDKTGFEWINKFGSTAWGKGESSPAYDWFKLDGARKAYIGEDTLISFIKSWANVDPKDACGLDTISKILTGDITELQTLFKSIPKNEVQILLGVKDKYQDVYTKYFDRPYRKGFDAWKKALEKDYGEFKSDYQHDLHLRPFEGNSQMSTDTPTDVGAMTAGKPAYNF